ncbi:hypothetical protein [Afifella sp. YEN Y35]|uniref:hypothetical protein n=1 Tax=Afifella sp. YEN Y35 TaxID=3388337 RepID=UPI0039DFE85C
MKSISAYAALIGVTVALVLGLWGGTTACVAIDGQGLFCQFIVAAHKWQTLLAGALAVLAAALTLRTLNDTLREIAHQTAMMRADRLRQTLRQLDRSKAYSEELAACIRELQTFKDSPQNQTSRVKSVASLSSTVEECRGACGDDLQAHISDMLEKGRAVAEAFRAC